MPNIIDLNIVYCDAQQGITMRALNLDFRLADCSHLITFMRQAILFQLQTRIFDLRLGGDPPAPISDTLDSV